MGTTNIINDILASLTDDEKQLLKDTIIHGSWGDDSIEFTPTEIGCLVER